ncbi:baculoviral IAP repeat-containing protein 8-like [Phlebotomus papatasi]|uniref:baculoviral IAP repeat-containing protein 8-like n=1 Tax=Phlebotomus papatasi TaxID=29031 RepID=UPI002484563D|nr:baculoviral IAP repeat-containing protein 8-like [Phlebotomus papatasi]
MENIENYYQQAARLQTFDYCPHNLTLERTEKCTLARMGFLYRTSTNTIVCIKCQESFAFDTFEATLQHVCGATSQNWDDLNIPIPSPCTTDDENLASETFRLETFLKYPLTPSLLDAERLASSGFYHDKLPDHIKCYACGFGLCYVTKNPFEPSYAIKAHSTFSSQCEPRERDQNHKITNFLNSEGGKYLLDAGYAANSIKSILKKRIANNEGLTVEQITQDILTMRAMAKDEEALINTIENLNIMNPEDSAYDNGALVMDLLNQAQLENENLKEGKLCKICLTEDVAMAFIPCGHFIACETCSRTLQMCPICRKNIERALKIFQ